MDFIVAATEEGTLYGVYPDGTIKFEYHTEYPITTSPSIYDENGYLYIIFGNSNGDIYAVNLNGNQNTKRNQQSVTQRILMLKLMKVY